MLIFFFYFFILISLIGYGLLAEHKIFKTGTFDLGYLGFIGLFSLIIISYFSSFFLPHNKIYNLFFILFGFLNFIFFLNKKIIKKKDFINIILIFIVLFVFILVGKNHDDFFYYHFPYTLLLTEYPHQIGMGDFNHGFRTPSSIFFLSSIFYLPKIHYYLFHISSVFFLGFFNFIILNKIFNKNNYKNNKFIVYLSLFSFAFVNIFFYRLAEYGTDRAAMILIFLIVIELLFVYNNNLGFKANYQKINLILILMFIVISLKAFYLIYLLLILPILFLYNNLQNIVSIFLNKIFLACVLLLTFIFIINIFNTGCFLYPAGFTCIENLDWSIPISQVEQMKVHYENWAKAGAGPNFKVDNPEEYIKNFNWFLNWVDKYFFNKVSDFLLSLIFLSLIFFLLFFNKKKIYGSRKISILPIYLLLIFFFIEWFIFHPALRYGGYHLIALLLMIPISIILEKYHQKEKLFYKKVLCIISITIIIFLGRNIFRLSKEYNLYSYNPIKNTNFILMNNPFIYNQQISKIIGESNKCKNGEINDCKDKKLKKKFNRHVLKK